MPLIRLPEGRREPMVSPLWRYMDLPRFAALLGSQCLWFANAEQLSKDDPFEISLPDRFATDQISPSFRKRVQLVNVESADRLEQKRLLARLIESRPDCYVNCWHLSAHESVAMWKTYGLSSGVAITTTEDRLLEVFAKERRRVFAAEVTYIDYRFDDVDAGSLINVGYIKREEFSYEREYRLMFVDPDQLEGQLAGETDGSRPKGVGITCSLDELIDTIWISPFSEGWYERTVVQVCEKFGVQAKIQRSSLLQEPLSRRRT